MWISFLDKEEFLLITLLLEEEAVEGKVQSFI